MDTKWMFKFEGDFNLLQAAIHLLSIIKSKKNRNCLSIVVFNSRIGFRY